MTVQGERGPIVLHKDGVKRVRQDEDVEQHDEEQDDEEMEIEEEHIKRLIDESPRRGSRNRRPPNRFQ